MPDRVHYHPNLIYTLGTQVVALVEILSLNGRVLHPRGSVGVVIRTPTDLEHPYRVRFPDGVEESLNRDQLTMLAYIPDLIERKVSGTEKGRLEKADLGFHQREFERLRAELEQAYKECKLPDAPSGSAALHELLVRIRLGNNAKE